MDKSEAKRLGKPYCDLEMLYLPQENGRSMKRTELKEKLTAESYSKYCLSGVKDKIGKWLVII